MNAELEKWIEENTVNSRGIKVVTVQDLRALFDGKVLVPVDSVLALPQWAEETEWESDLKYRIQAGIILLEMFHPNLETLIETLKRCEGAVSMLAASQEQGK
jgi:hypothetical protein